MVSGQSNVLHYRAFTPEQAPRLTLVLYYLEVCAENVVSMHHEKDIMGGSIPLAFEGLLLIFNGTG